MREVTFSGLSVLVLDDEALLCRRLAAYLEGLGADVTTAGTLEAARRLAGELRFDFALVDVNLPDGLGTDLLRDGGFGEETGVVIMTAEGGVQGAVEAMRLGARDYLVKPFEPEELPLVLRRVRAARREARLTEQRRAETEGDGFFFGEALAPVRRQLDKILAADRRLGKGLPPLRERGEDILRLAGQLLTRICQRHRLPERRVSPAGRRRLLAYPWPGNVRELAHEIERAVVFAEEDDLGFEHLPVDPGEPAAAEDGGAEGGPAVAPGADWLNPAFRFPAEGFSLERAIRRLIDRALEQSGGNVSAAARLLGVSRDYLRYRLAGKRGT